MPEISRFFGIRIRMYHDDHRPPHFHAVYGDDSVAVEIGSGVVHGRFPPRALRLVIEWYHLHRQELLVDWHLVTTGNLPEPIDPLK